jgi:hypothetical protein
MEVNGTGTTAPANPIAGPPSVAVAAISFFANGFTIVTGEQEWSSAAAALTAMKYFRLSFIRRAQGRE